MELPFSRNLIIKSVNKSLEQKFYKFPSARTCEFLIMQKKSLIKKYIKQALKLGAFDAKQIRADTIVTAQWVRLKCQYGCSGYRKRLTCPPYSPSPEETAKILKSYQSALLIHCDDHTDIAHIVTTIERRAFLDGFYKAFAMSSGPCRFCGKCDPENEKCRHPVEARPAMEACGIDVFQTVRNNELPIEVVKNQTCEQNYYGLILIE